jgi:hypothetical protein
VTGKLCAWSKQGTGGTRAISRGLLSWRPSAFRRRSPLQPHADLPGTSCKCRANNGTTLDGVLWSWSFTLRLRATRFLDRTCVARRSMGCSHACVARLLPEASQGVRPPRWPHRDGDGHPALCCVNEAGTQISANGIDCQSWAIQLGITGCGSLWSRPDIPIEDGSFELESRRGLRVRLFLQCFAAPAQTRESWSWVLCSSDL